MLDEPTAHLDAATAAAVGEAIERLAAGRTTLLIAHDPAIADRAAHIHTLADGQLAGACQLRAGQPDSPAATLAAVA